MTENSAQIPVLNLVSANSSSSNPSINLLKDPHSIKNQQMIDIDEAKLYNQHLSPSPNINKNQWTPQQDKLVYQLHNQFGNKWALIAERLKGRTDNCIKNHFYSRLRKGLRKINNLIQKSYSKHFKQFKIIELYKLIEASDEKFKEINSYPNQITDFGHDLKNRLFIFAEQEHDETLEYDMKAKKFLEDMNDFSKNYKRKSKKSRRYSPMGISSVYRNNKKPSKNQLTQTGDVQIEKQINHPKIQSEEKVKIQMQDKLQEKVQKKWRKKKSKKQILKLLQNQKPTETQAPKNILIQAPLKKQNTRQISVPELLQVDQEPPLSRTKSRNTYRKFSDDEGQQKDDAEYMRQQRLNNFAQNILKTFKSYYSFKSFKSNSMMDDLIFQ